MSEWVLSEPNQKDVCDTPLKSLYKRPIGYDLILYAREKQREREGSKEFTADTTRISIRLRTKQEHVN